jgi:hypothetical protein
VNPPDAIANPPDAIVTPTCTDGIKNGTESDVDCGGSCGATCATGKKCGSASHCLSKICTAGLCQAVPVIVDLAVNSSANDAEESLTTGMVAIDSSDLELDYDADLHTQQMVGIRFVNVTVPKAATITNAYVQFTPKYTRSMATALTIKGQAIDNAPHFTTVSRSISARVATAAQTVWSPVPAWVSDNSDATTRTPDLKPILQEIVNRPGWSAANAFVLLISGNGGDRTAVSYDGRSAAAPRLHVEYVVP